jgi:hypothetical protein
VSEIFGNALKVAEFVSVPSETSQPYPPSTDLSDPNGFQSRSACADV